MNIQSGIEACAFDDATFSAYSLSTRRGTQGITHEQAQQAVARFTHDTQFDFEGRSVVLDIRPSSRAAFGPAGEHLRCKGAFLPASNRLVLITSNLVSEDDAYETVRHELLVHYGLNLLPAEEKRELLDLIVDTQQDPRFKALWAPLQHDAYRKTDLLKKAEEVLAFVAQRRHGPLERVWDRMVSVISRGLQKIGFLSHGIHSPRELHQVVETLTERIRRGDPQRIFPANNQAQFRAADSVSVPDQSIDLGVEPAP